MYLVRLVYASTICKDFTDTAIQEILEKARIHNGRSNVTGVLCFSSNYFLQCLEGSRANVNTTYHRILNDPRHTNIVMLDYKEISQRDFFEWSMGYAPASSHTRPLNIKYSGSGDFNPYEMSGESASRLLLELRNNVPVL